MRPDTLAPDRQLGFTLLEVLVAFVIAAIALAVLYEGAVGSLRTTSVAGRYQEALSHARSHLAALDAGNPVAGEQSGDDGGGFHWRVQTVQMANTPLGSPGDLQASGPGTPRAVLYAVHVSVSWNGDGGSRVVTLDSERLGISVPPPP